MLSLNRLILTVALATLSGSATADTFVYITGGQSPDDFPGQFGTLDVNTGAFQQIGPTGPEGYFGLAPGPNGSLVTLTYAGNLNSINPATGVPTVIGPTGLGNCLVISPACSLTTSAFSVGGFNGKIYATDFHNDIYVVNPLSGTATLLSAHSGLPASPFVLGSPNPDGTLNYADEAIFQAGGKLYATFDALIFNPNTGSVASVVVAPELYEIDPNTGLATTVGPTELGIGGAADVNGAVYAFDDLTNQAFTLHLASGSATLVGGFDPAAGVIQGAVATPEPAPIALAAIGVLIILLLKSRAAVSRHPDNWRAETS